jgi:putative ABC transport system permease protein
MMNRLRYLLTTVLMALRAIGRWPLQAALTSFGIMVGVLAVTVTVALGEGARQKVASQIDNLGSNALLVRPEGRIRAGVATGEVAPLREADGEVILREVSRIRQVAPIVSLREGLAFGATNTNAEVLGTTLAYFDVRNWQPNLGTLWDTRAEQAGARVCVLGETVRRELFGIEDPVGSVIRMGRIPLRVIGVLASKGQDSFGRDEDARIVVPLSSVRAKSGSAVAGRVDSLVLSATSSRDSAQAVLDVTRVLRLVHGLAEEAPNDFTVRSQAEFRAIQDRVLGILNTLLVSVAAVSLVVGGIGIMNIMLVSVTERTKEIGIRLAIGASETDVLIQFLVEAVVLSLLGGLLGALAAVVVVTSLGDSLGFTLSISPVALSVSLLVSCGVGVVFGFFPARRAARLDPIDALRGE